MHIYYKLIKSTRKFSPVPRDSLGKGSRMAEKLITYATARLLEYTHSYRFTKINKLKAETKS